jgi:hypothetical protein
VPAFEAPLLVWVDFVGSTLNVGWMYSNLPFVRPKKRYRCSRIGSVGRTGKPACAAASGEAVSGSNPAGGVKVVILTLLSRLRIAIFRLHRLLIACCRNLSGLNMLWPNAIGQHEQRYYRKQHRQWE